MTPSTREGTLVPRESTDRDEFSRAYLTLGIDETAARIHETVKGLEETETEDGSRIRTLEGMLVAVLENYVLPDGTLGTTLSYRVAPASLPATRKARKLWTALRPYQILRG